jgi:hypothetical protein
LKILAVKSGYLLILSIGVFCFCYCIVEEHGGYLRLIQRTVKPYIDEETAAGRVIEGGLAVVYDKNKMEASGYAATLADVFGEPVYLVEWYYDDPNPAVRYTEDRILEVFAKGNWHPLRACFRYVTQKPWTRLVIYSFALANHLIEEINPPLFFCIFEDSP